MSLTEMNLADMSLADMNLAEQFASLIDSTKFDEAAEMIADNCEYHYNGESHVGRRGVIATYRENHKYITTHFDEIRYHAEVEILDGETCKLHLRDEIRKGERWQEIKAEQKLSFNDGMIVRIDHYDLPGEFEAFRKFFQDTRS